MLQKKIELIKFLSLIAITIFLMYHIISSGKRHAVENRLIDLTQFSYVLNNNMCDEHEEIFALILVASEPGDDQMRKGHRNALSKYTLEQMKILRIFLIGQISTDDNDTTDAIQNKLNDEQNEFNDLIQGNFIDTAKFFSYKVGMGFKWATSKCSKAQYIIKTNEDTVFNIYHIYKFLKTYDLHYMQEALFIAGYVKYNMEDSEEEFFVSLQEDDDYTYPHFVLDILYITNQMTAKALLLAAEKTTYDGYEVAYFTGTVRDKIHCPMQFLNNWYTAYAADIYRCVKSIEELGQFCGIHVGPSNGDPELFSRYIKAVQQCMRTNCISVTSKKTGQ